MRWRFLATSDCAKNHASKSAGKLERLVVIGIGGGEGLLATVGWASKKATNYRAVYTLVGEWKGRNLWQSRMA
jgi:hypothetical protein